MPVGGAGYRRRMESLMFRTERIAVRPWSSEDAGWYVSAIDGEINRWTRSADGDPESNWAATLERASDPASPSFCIQNVVGDPVGLLAIRVHDESVELSYWVAADQRGMGYATEALVGAIHRCRAVYPGVTLMLEIHPGNASSIAVAEKAGFSFAEIRGSCAPCADENGQVAVYTVAP